MSAINVDALMAWLALSAAASALLAWQYRANPQKARGWQGASAISLELLAAGLAVHWALNNGQGALSVLFVAGVIGLAVAKATLLPGLVATAQRGQYGAFGVGLVATLGAYLTIYLLGAMSGLEGDTERTAEAIAQSAPLQAVEAEIESTRQRLAGLAGFADASRAHSEEQAAQAAAAALAEQRQQLQAQLSAARAKLAGCPKGYKTNCINPANAEIAAIDSQLSGLVQAPAASGGYASRHAEYNGLQSHLSALEQRRAELLSSDSTASAGLSVGVSDRMLSWLTGLPEEKARSLKWLLLVAVFDILSGLIRLFSEMTYQADQRRELIGRFAALLDAGLDARQAAGILAGSVSVTPPAPAQSAPVAMQPVLSLAPNRGRLFAMLQGAPNDIGADKGAPSVVFRDRERVSNELSQVAGRGRVGKVDACRDCGADFLVETYNGTRCKSCSEKAQASYRAHKARLKG